MSRIDSNIATQIGEILRPPQTVRDGQLQSQQAQTQSNDGTMPVTAEDMRSVAQQLKQVIELHAGKKIAFQIDESDKELYLQVTDGTTGEVIGEIPSKNIRQLRQSLTDMLGMLVDKKA